MRARLAALNPPWIGRPYVTALTINRLGQRDIDVMIDRVVSLTPWPGQGNESEFARDRNKRSSAT
jgi:hypothetical protein